MMVADIVHVPDFRTAIDDLQGIHVRLRGNPASEQETSKKRAITIKRGPTRVYSPETRDNPVTP